MLVNTFSIRRLTLQSIRYKHNIGKMNAIVVSSFGDPSVLKYASTDIPKIGSNQCLIDLKASGVNPVDTYIRSGIYGKLPILPYIPGKDGAGIVSEVGADVSNFKVGDRVYLFNSPSGTYAEKCACNSSNMFLLPDNTSYAQGACLGTPAFTAYRALFQKAKATPGESVFVHGASGGVGLMVVQMAASAGMHVVGTAGTAEGLDAVRAAGARDVYNHRDHDYMSLIQSKYPSGLNVCIEMLASSNLELDFGLMAIGGRIVIVGSRGSLTINPRGIMAKELQVSGVMLLSATSSDLHEMGSYVYAGLSNGTLQPLVGMEVPLANASYAHAEVMSRNALNVGNIVMMP